MASVDNRIVNMEFNNAKFESGVRQTLHSLSQLDKALKMDGASKGLDDVSRSAGLFTRALNFVGVRRGLADTGRAAADLDKSMKFDGAQKGLADVSTAAQRVDLTPVSTGASQISTAFLAMSTIAITALSMVTQAAIQAGTRITKALSLDTVMEGFGEYELNMNSIQTILANTKADGTNLEQVNAALDQLNTYSDQTIYNFAEMARNIGTFTAAGVDLDTSVSSIKGIANLAAISGSSSQQAATAMYQLSQAISTGTVRLMDWNSVVNAGMGGEVFQRALFESGKAMKTLKGVDMGTTFEEWKDSGNNFRDSLQDGWLTGEVLTTTLGGISGELDKATLMSKGFSAAQADALVELGATGVAAATEVRTLTQLISTIKESIASGWSATFRTIFGDFEQATKLFTDINNAIGGFIGKQADARNAMLTIWSDLGGRDTLIQGLKDGFEALATVVVTIKNAFRDIFPRKTAGQLVAMTNSFADFMKRLQPSASTVDKIGRAFKGFFALLDLGWTTIKAGVGFLKDLFLEITGLGGGGFLTLIANVGDFFTAIREGVDQGQSIVDFFDGLMESLEGPLELIGDLRTAISSFFEGVGSGAGNAATEVTTWWQPFKDFADKVMEVLGNAGDAIGEWFGDIATKIAEAIDPQDADVILDAFNVSLLGGIAFLLGKWMKEGINFDFGGGFFENISNVLEEVTSTLEAMQTNLRADALMKIATAIAILTASLVVLSLIDSASLTRALTAMAVGFGQLAGVFAIISGLNAGITDGAIFTTVAAGMVVMAGAILLLSASVAILGNMSWQELLQGLGAVTVLLAGLTAAAVIISKYVSNIFVSAVALSALGVALLILTGSVAILGNMDFDNLVRGLGATAVLLGVVTGAAVLISKHAGKMLLSSVALVAMGTALLILSSAVSKLGTMDLATLAKGIGAIAIMLGLLVGAAVLISKHVSGILLASGAILILSISIGIMADALGQIGSMDLTSLIKGLVGMAAGLLILVGAAHLASGSIAGALAIAVLAGSLILMARALEVIGDLSIGQIASGLITLALAFGILLVAGFLAEKVSVGLLTLGAAMILVGASFALFGLGLEKIAEALILLGDNSDAAYEGVVTLGKAIPALLVGLAEGIVAFGTSLLKNLPQIVEIIAGILGALIEAITKVIPQIGELIETLLLTILEIIRTYYPEMVETALGLVLALLTGLSENVEPIIAAATELIVNLITGLKNGLPQIIAAAGELISAFLLAIAGYTQTIIDTGVQILVNFLLGISNNLQKVIDTVGVVIITFIGAVAGLAISIAQAGTDALVDFLGGMTDNTEKIVTAVTTLITTFVTSVANNVNRVVKAGADAIISFVQGLGKHAGRIIQAGVTVIIQFLKGVSNQTLRLATAAADILIDFLNALANVIEQKSGELREAGKNIAYAIADGISGGLLSKAKSLADQAAGLSGGILGAARGVLEVFSPSRKFFEIGQNVVQGLSDGLSDHAISDRAAATMAEDSMSSARKVLSRVAEELSTMDELVSPVITPVLDLSEVERTASDFSMDDPSLWAPRGSFGRAQLIAKSPNPSAVESTSTEASSGGVSFEQNIYAPKQLSTSDIYKHTRNQITFAKEKLEVP